MSYNEFSDEKLLCLLQEGDEKSLEIIVLRYWAPLYIVAFKILDDRHSCEDVIQEIFIKIWLNREKLNVSYSLKAYLFAATRYEVYHQVKLHVQKQERIELGYFKNIEKYNPHNELEYGELLSSVEKIVDSLPERCKEVYLLSREEQLSHKEISLRLKISTKTVENHITIALGRLRSMLNRTLF
jgi:RNA polymerase sigma-70 factor (ECF subfamily)